MPTAAEINPLSKVRALVYGRFKMGKTEGAATFPRPNFISFDQGMSTLASPGFRERHPKVRLNEVLYQDFYELRRNPVGIPLFHNAFDDACRYFDAYMEGAKWTSPYDGKVYDCSPEKFDTWVIDSGTSLSSVAMVKAIILLGDRAAMGSVLSNTYDSARKSGLIVPKMQDFGSERSLVEQFTKMIYDSGKHVIFICHEKENTNKAGAVTEIVPLLTGQSVERICLMFDEVYRLIGGMRGAEFKRYLQTQPDGIAKCGSRGLGVPDGTEWTWDAIKAHAEKSNPKLKL